MNASTDRSHVSWLKCMDCGAKVPLYGTTKFTCECGGLYDVEHDHSGLKARGAYDYKKIFDERCRPGPHVVRRSGVWRFKELIMPSLDGGEIVSLGEGIIPIQPAGYHLRKWIGGSLDLWIMPEGLTTTGSFKDFGGTVAISVAKASGVKSVVGASTGDTSAMAAAYSAAAGLSCSVVLPKGLTTDVQLSQPVAHGAKVVLIPGSFDDAMHVVRKLVDAGRAFPINSINPTRIEGHQATVFLAVQFFGWEMPDAFVVPVGNGSNSSSVGKAMRLLVQLGLVDKTAKLIGVQSAASDPLARSWETIHEYAKTGGVVDGRAFLDRWQYVYKPQAVLGKTTATAARIGNPVSYKKVMREIIHSNGAVLTAGETGLNLAVMIAGQDGHLICPQTGTALEGLRQAVDRGFIKKGSRVVVVSTATGLKFPEVAASYAKKFTCEAPSCEVEAVADLIGV